MLESMLFRYVYHPEKNPYEKTALLKQAERAIQQTKRNEPYVLLELALWKAACILHPPEGRIRDATSFFTWASGGWKANKGAMRHDAMIGSVIENVMPFLEGKNKKRKRDE